MKESGILLLLIWAFGLILLPQTGHAEMDALTEDEMQTPMFDDCDFSQVVNPGSEKDIVTENNWDDYDYSEKIRMENEIRFGSTLGGRIWESGSKRLPPVQTPEAPETAE